MAIEESAKTENSQENIEESAKKIKEKTSDTIDKMAEGVKKASEKADDAIENIKEGTKKAGEKADAAIENIKEGTKKAGEKASDVVGNILSGLKKVGDKATDTVKILEIKREISQLESVSKKIEPQISDAVLALYAEKKINDPTLTTFCEEIEKNKKLIEEKKAQIKVIEENKTE